MMKNPTAFAMRNGYRAKGPTADGDAPNQPLVRGDNADELKYLKFTAHRALISDANGGMDHSTITSSELAYLAGLTGNVQTQLDAKAPLASPAFTGDPTAPTQTPGNNSTRIATTAYCDTAIATRLAIASNLSDLNNVATARTNLGLGDLAVLSAITKSQISDLETIATTSTANALVKANGAGKIVDGWLTANVPLLNASNTFTVDQTLNGNISASRFLAGSGSASLPSISLSGDPNTGIYSSVADHLEIAAAGGRVAYFNSSGLTVDAATAGTNAAIRAIHSAGFTQRWENTGTGGGYYNWVVTNNLYGTSGGRLLLLENGTTTTNSILTVFGGKFGLGQGNYSPTCLLDVLSDTFRLRTARTPASASATGNAGDWCWDTSYIYVCTATNTWKRATLLSW